MSAETEKSLREWETNDRDYCDDLHWHFREFGRWEWLEVRDEGLRIYNLMTGEDAEPYSVIDGVIAAVSAQAYHGAIGAVAAALGVDAKHLEFAVAEWSEKQDALPPPAGSDGLMKLVAEYAAEDAEITAVRTGG